MVGARVSDHVLGGGCWDIASYFTFAWYDKCSATGCRRNGGQQVRRTVGFRVEVSGRQAEGGEGVGPEVGGGGVS
jgi:hypothetical protein